MKRSHLVAVLTFIILLTMSAAVFAAPGDRLLKQGMRGEDVRYVQNLLSEKGYYVGAVDGIYGSNTEQAVRDFQISNGLMPDGIVGTETIRYLERSAAEPTRYSRALTMSASAYSAYDDGNGSYTYRGNLLRKGLVAVDPSVIPLGTRLYIEGYGYAIADDIGGAIKGNRIDLAFDTRAEALQFGRQRVTVYILD